MCNNEHACVEPALQEDQADRLPQRRRELVAEHAVNVNRRPSADNERCIEQTQVDA